MITITEDYVSFEIAKLLKEKGFNCECSKFYMPSGHGIWKYEHYHDFDISDRIECPTIQMAMKWLREVHNIHIDIDPDWASKGGFAVIGYCFNIHSIVNPWYEDLVTYPTYEQAVEAAIKYCLENLI